MRWPPQSPLGTCIPWCSPETPSADTVWKVPVPGGWQAGPGNASMGPASSCSGSTCFPSSDGPCCANTDRGALVNRSCQVAYRPDTADLRQTKSPLCPAP